MQIAVKHDLEIPDVQREDGPQLEAFCLPMAEAQAVMGETIAAFLRRVAWRFDLPTVCRIGDEYYGREEWDTRALAVNDNAVQFVSRPLSGFTGYGGKYEPAGTVHRGEYVIDAGTVGRIGRGFFDGLRGYADSGFVEMPDMRSAPMGAIPAANSNTPTMTDARSYSFDLRGSNLTRDEVQGALTQALAANNAQRDRPNRMQAAQRRRAA